MGNMGGSEMVDDAVIDVGSVDAAGGVDAAGARPGVSPGGLATERLEEELRSLAGHIAAATASFLVLVGEYDLRGGWRAWEVLSCAHWLNWRCGVGMTAAREQVRVARRLRELPVIAAEFAAGRLSYSKVRAITRVAHAGIEHELVSLAQSGTAAHVERACAALRRARRLRAAEADLVDAEQRSQMLRSLSWSRDWDSGDVVLKARIPAEAAEVFLAGLGTALAQAQASPGPDRVSAMLEREESLEQRRVDALIAMAALFSATAPPDPSLAAQPDVIIHVDAVALLELTDTTPGDPPAEEHAAEEHVGAVATDPCRPEPGDTHLCDIDIINELGRVSGWPITTARGAHLTLDALLRLSCDGGQRVVVHLPDGTDLDAGRHRRRPGHALRRFLLRRDGRCRFPGCAQHSRLRAHHIVHWAARGPTTAQNLILLCAKHHRAVHEGGWQLVGTGTQHTFTRPDGRHVAEHAPVLGGSPGGLIEAHRLHGRDITVDGAGGHWCGDRIDWDCFFAAFDIDPPHDPPP